MTLSGQKKQFKLLSLLSQLHCDWLPVTNRRFEWQVIGDSAPITCHSNLLKQKRWHLVCALFTQTEVSWVCSLSRHACMHFSKQVTGYEEADDAVCKQFADWLKSGLEI